MECAFCEATLEDPDRCVACGRGQPAEAPGGEAPGLAAPARRRDSATIPVLLLLSGLLLVVLAPAVEQASDGVAGLMGILGTVLVAAAFFVPLVMILRRLDALARGT